MRDVSRGAFLQSNSLLYRLARPLLFARSAQRTHEDMLRLLATLDDTPTAQAVATATNRAAFCAQPVTLGGVTLPHPFILAAGFVKGRGFVDEQAALRAVRQGENIMPGWRTMPNLVGPVEFGSFTPHPRLGNPGTVIWRDAKTYSSQNRVGLKNPGAVAAAAFLHRQAANLPDLYGVNIAPSPGIDAPQEEQAEVLEAISAFIARGLRPAWFTLNLSCPNTEDDPAGNQTEAKAEALAGAIVDLLAKRLAGQIPLWVKVGPCLSDAQYTALMRAFARVGVRAVIATNTLPQPAPGQPQHTAGVGGGRLHRHALHAASALMRARSDLDSDVDVIGCGGVQDPVSYRAFTRLGVRAVQYWSALIYRGPLAAALIQQEVNDHD